MCRLPVLLDIKGPFEFKVSDIVVVDELGHCAVVSSVKHATWSVFLFDCSRSATSPRHADQGRRRTRLLVHRIVRLAWAERADHLLSLLAYAVPLHDLEVLQAGQDLVLDLELDLHTILSAFLDCERRRFKVLQLAGMAEVDDDVRTTFDLATVNEYCNQISLQAIPQDPKIE